MATLNFPDSPDTGDLYTDSNSGFTYEWNGTVWISKDPSSTSNIKELDNISSSFNGSTTAFTLQVGGVNVVPADVQQLVINIGNVMQNAGDDYTVSGSTITFTTAPAAGLTFFGTILGTKLSLSTVADSTISPASLTTTSNNYVISGLTVDETSGIITAYQFKGDGSQLTGVGYTDNIVTSTDAIFNANVNIAGSLTLQGTETTINVDELNVQDKTLGIGSTNAPSPITQNLSGVILYGQTNVHILYENDKAALGISTSVNVAGIVTATTYYGRGSTLTGVASSLYPLSYHPGISSTTQPVSAVNNANKIELKWNYPIKAGTGTIELREGSASGTVKDQFVVGTSNSITIAATKLTLNPAVGLTTNTNYFVVLPAGAIKSSGDQQQNSVINGYSYTTAPYALSQLWGSGYNAGGRLGQNNTISQSSPIQISGSLWARIGGDVDGGLVATRQDGTLWSWGDNEDGNLGLNQDHTVLNSVSSPTQVGTDTNWQYLAKGDTSTLAVQMATKNDGTLWTWGYNDSGQLGINDTSGSGRSSPCQVGTDTTWPQDGNSKMVMGYTSKCAIKTNGTLWTWGNGTSGQTGHNDQTQRSSPTQVGTETTWKEITTVEVGTLAIKTDGTLWSWGHNELGQLGLNQPHPTKISSPTQVGTDTTWSSIQGSGGGRYAYYTGAIKTDGTLWMWGGNEYGALGLNQGHDVENRSSPTQVGTDTNWVHVNTNRYVTYAIKTDGTAWAWGNDSYGVWGTNVSTQSQRSSPTQIMSDKNFVRLNGTAMDSTAIAGARMRLEFIIKEP